MFKLVSCVLYMFEALFTPYLSLADKKDVDAAVQAASDAFHGPWSKMTPSERAALMFKLADLIDRDNEELSQIETLDNGKGITFSRLFDVKQIAITLRYFAGYADKVHGKVIDTEGALSYTRHEPIGVCGAIIPWNFPLMMLGEAINDEWSRKLH